MQWLIITIALWAGSVYAQPYYPAQPQKLTVDMGEVEPPPPPAESKAIQTDSGDYLSFSGRPVSQTNWAMSFWARWDESWSTIDASFFQSIFDSENYWLGLLVGGGASEIQLNGDVGLSDAYTPPTDEWFFVAVRFTDAGGDIQAQFAVSEYGSAGWDFTSNTNAGSQGGSWDHLSVAGDVWGSGAASSFAYVRMWGDALTFTQLLNEKEYPSADYTPGLFCDSSWGSATDSEFPNDVGAGAWTETGTVIVVSGPTLQNGAGS